MKKHSCIVSNVFGLAVLALAIGTTGSAIAASATATSTGTVVAPLNISVLTNLSFGSFAPSVTDPGTVTIAPNGARSVSTGLAEMGGTPAAASFTVTGQSGLGYGIVLGGTGELISGANKMAFTPVSDFTASNKTSGTVDTSTLSGTAQTLYVGGVLAVAANQPAGVYTGDVSATVTYN